MKKLLAIFLGALMVVSMLPVVAMAASGDAVLIPNGDFEDAFVSLGGKTAPSSEWNPAVAESMYNPGGVFRLESDTITVGEEEVTVSPATSDSTAFFKVDRNLSRYENARTGRDVYVNYAFPADAFTAGKSYALEFDYYVPFASGDGASASVRITTVNSTTDAQVVAGVNQGVATGGWVHFRDMFTATAGTTYYLCLQIKSGTSNDFILYVDNIDVYEYANNNIIPNGDFEFSFKRAGNNSSNPLVPALTWDHFITAAGGGEISAVASDVVDDTTILPPVAESTKFLKIQKNATSQFVNYNFRVDDKMEKNGLYKLEFYYNIPKTLGGSGVNFGFVSGGNYNSDVSGYQSCLVKIRTAATDGWQKVSVGFKYVGLPSSVDMMNFRIGMRDTAVGDVAYIDEVKLVKVGQADPNSLMKADGSFTIISDIDTTNYKQHGSATKGTNYDLVPDPTNPQNTVLKQIYTESGSREIIKFEVNDSGLTTNDLIKMNMRVYVVADSAPADSFDLNFQYRMDGKTRSVSYHGTPVAIAPNEVNKWIDLEFIMTPLGISETAHHEFILGDCAQGYDILIDDVVAVPVTASSITNITGTRRGVAKALNDTTTGGFGLDTFDSRAYSYRKASAETVSRTETYIPSVIYVAPEAGANAYEFIALYKVEEGQRTLVDIKSHLLSATTAGAVTSPTTTFQMNMAEANLEADATYELKTFVWSAAGLAPIINSAVSVAAN